MRTYVGSIVPDPLTMHDITHFVHMSRTVSLGFALDFHSYIILNKEIEEFEATAFRLNRIIDLQLSGAPNVTSLSFRSSEYRFVLLCLSSTSIPHNNKPLKASSTSHTHPM